MPKFITDAYKLAKIAANLSIAELRVNMKIYEQLAILTQKQFKNFILNPNNLQSKPAIFAFAGGTYQGLGAVDFNTDDLIFAQKHLRILSGLYGLLRPMDRIQPYRLEMGRKFISEKETTLYQYWGKRIGLEIERCAAGAAIINLSSVEYFKAVGTEIKTPIITPIFKQQRNNNLKVIGFYAKKARGCMARYIIQNRFAHVESLKYFCEDSYRFRPDLSNTARYVFTRTIT